MIGLGLRKMYKIAPTVLVGAIFRTHNRRNIETFSRRFRKNLPNISTKTLSFFRLLYLLLSAKTELYYYINIFIPNVIFSFYKYQNSAIIFCKKFQMN